MDRIPNYLILKQIEARGAVVHGCGTRRGHKEDGKYKAGKPRDSILKKMVEQRFMHPDAVLAVADAIKES
eukprot:11424209-Ditylum_brightwellii.AAC.1